MRGYGPLRLELGSTGAAIRREEGVILDFAGVVSKGYLSLVREQSTSYRHCLNAVLVEVQMRGTYLSWSRVRVSESGQWLRIGDPESDEERDCCTSPHGARVDEDEVAPPTRNPNS